MASSVAGLPKEKKKLCKKINRLKETLLKKENISTIDKPSMILCVCNGGLDNNVSYEEMLELFCQYGRNCDVIMIPQKSYAFVCFTSVEESERACTHLNGHMLPVTDHRKNEVVLYTFFVSEVSGSISPSRDKPPGLILIEDAVSEEYAAEIMMSLTWEDSPQTAANQQQLKHRRVKHYGYEFKYSINNVDPDHPLPEGIPDVYRPLLEKLLNDGVVKHYPDQLTINQYQPGQGIPPHVDTPSAFEDGLISLSLGSQVLMEFRHPDGRHLSVLLPPRSVVVMTGESRYTWSHGITPRKSDIVPVEGGGLTLSQRGVRTSFTFRKLTGVRPSSEDSDKPRVPCDDSTAAELEKLHVYQVYEEIADHFSGTRHTPWPNIAEFLRQQAPGSLLADIGCGNGKYFGINRSLFEIGSDRSYNLAKIVQDRNYQVYVGDILSIPLRSGVFDVCLCIAVIHHLSTETRRQRAVSELLRILKPGGRALIYVWAMEQELNKVKSKYLKGNKSSDREKTLECSQNCNTVLPIENSSMQEKRDESCINCSEEQTAGAVSNSIENLKQTRDFTEESMDVNKKCDGKDTELTDNASEENIKKMAQPRSSNEAQKLEVHVNRTQFKQQDLLVPWQLKSKQKNVDASNTFHRFYHVFKKGELEVLCESVNMCKVVKSYHDQGNWAVILEKL